MYKPLQKINKPPKILMQKHLYWPLRILAPVGLYLEIILKYKKQTNKAKIVYSNTWICQRTISL